MAVDVVLPRVGIPICNLGDWGTCVFFMCFYLQIARFRFRVFRVCAFRDCRYPIVAIAWVDRFTLELELAPQSMRGCS